MTDSTNSSPTWISHRGYKETAVENTLESFRAAIGVGFNNLETDLRLSSDNQLVLIHDQTLERITGDTKPVLIYSREKLEAIRLRNGEKLLFFDQFAEEFGGCNWTLDIKPEEGNKTITELFDWIKKNNSEKGFKERAKFVTWDANQEELLHSLIPGVACYASHKECRRTGLAALLKMSVFGSIKPGRTYSLPARFHSMPLYRRSIAEAYHRRRASLLAYLPETDDDARAAKEAGFDEILTDGKII